MIRSTCPAMPADFRLCLRIKVGRVDIRALWPVSGDLDAAAGGTSFRAAVSTTMSSQSGMPILLQGKVTNMDFGKLLSEQSAQAPIEPS